MTTPLPQGLRLQVSVKKLQQTFESSLPLATKLITTAGENVNPSPVTELAQRMEMFEIVCDEIATILEYNRSLLKMRITTGTSIEQISSSEAVQKLNAQARDAKNTKSLMDEFKMQLLQLSQIQDSNSNS